MQKYRKMNEYELERTISPKKSTLMLNSEHAFVRSVWIDLRAENDDPISKYQFQRKVIAIKAAYSVNSLKFFGNRLVQRLSYLIIQRKPTLINASDTLMMVRFMCL